MLLDDAVHIVINGGTGHNTCLGTAVHRKLINIEAGLIFHQKRAVCNHFFQGFPGFFINTVRIGIDRIVKLSLCTVNF